MSTTVMLTGMLPFIVLVAAVLAVPVAWFLLRLYSRAVRRGMIAGGTAGAGTNAIAGTPPTADLEIVDLPIRSDQVVLGEKSLKFRVAAFSCWRAALAYAIAGAAYAAVMTTGLLLSDRTQAVVSTKIALLFWTYFWPVVPAAVLVAAYDRKRRLQVFGGYTLVFLFIAVVGLLRNPDLHLTDLLLYWIITNGPATLLVMAFLYKPIRAVGPLVLAFLIAASVGSQVLLSVADQSNTFLRGVVGIGSSAGLGAVGTFIAMIVAGTLLFSIAIGWPALRILGRRYERKKFSDQSLTLDTIWLVFAVVQSIYLAFQGPLWILTGLFAFLAYKIVSAVAFRRLLATQTQGPSTTLLLLRVFSLGKRSESLFDKLRRHWQYLGGTLMIAGPDLVTTTVEPHEFLDFVRGRLGRRFVSGIHDVEGRLASLDTAADPDGRHRITEFFCHNDTWQMTVERLAAFSDVVLMDLRSFSPSNRGCVFELGRLLDAVDLNRIVFLIDATTDRSYLESTLQRLWRSVCAESKNRLQPAPRARLFPVSRQDEPELRALMGHLLAVT
ncbi:MAG TPA: hypothetical protein VMT56_03075 [Candidatus Bathyarchaeia archaeon]|nr:hypothetical protein [Candidatus Bathyarchaeia archaeon]